MRIFIDDYFDIQISIRTAVDSSFTLALYSQLLTGLYAGRNVDFNLDLFLEISLALAACTGFLYLFTRTLAVRTGRFRLHHSKHCLLLTQNSATAVTGRTYLDVILAACTGSHTFGTLFLHVQVDILGNAVNGIHEIDSECHYAVAALPWTCGSL